MSGDLSPERETMFSDNYLLPRRTYKEPSRQGDDSLKLKAPELAPQSPSIGYKISSLANRRQQIPLPHIQTFSPSWRSQYSSTGQDSGFGPETSPEKYQSSRREIKSDREGIDPGEFCESQSMADYDDPRFHVDEAILDMYQSCGNTRSPGSQTEYPRRKQSLLYQSTRSKNAIGTLNTPNGMSSTANDPMMVPASRPSAAPRETSAAVAPSPQFSPLPLYFRGQSFPCSKKGEKVMIGRNGWLECTSHIYNQDSKRPHAKRMGFIDNIKKIAKDVTAELNASYRRPNASAPELPSPQVAISLDIREQSLLYCELEYNLTSSLNDYIVSEFDRGHLVLDNLKKISDHWLQQGRPRVISFRYDLETQLDLVALHLNEFNFYGRRQSNPSEIMGLLQAMKTNARSMRIRTFCQPDSVIAKQLVDSQSLFNMLNVSNAQQLALAEIAQFFKMILDRERAAHELTASAAEETVADASSRNV